MGSSPISKINTTGNARKRSDSDERDKKDLSKELDAEFAVLDINTQPRDQVLNEFASKCNRLMNMLPEWQDIKPVIREVVKRFHGTEQFSDKMKKCKAFVKKWRVYVVGLPKRTARIEVFLNMQIDTIHWMDVRCRKVLEKMEKYEADFSKRNPTYVPDPEDSSIKLIKSL
jgi:hypothetical protein